MARRSKKKSYVEAPAVPPEMADRVDVAIQVMSGGMTVSDGARKLGLARVHWQTLLHRSQAAFIEALLPHPAGRPKRPEREVELEAELERLRKENASLRSKQEAIEQVLDLSNQFLRGAPNKARGHKVKTATKVAAPAPEEPDPEEEQIRAFLTAAEKVLRPGLPVRIAAAVLGFSCDTLERWLTKAAGNEPLRSRRVPPDRMAAVEPNARAEAEHRVRELRGNIGAEALSRGVPALSRRQAAAIKAETKRKMERERKQAAQRVIVSHPGVVRGFDAMDVKTAGGLRRVLISADAAVPFRTSILVTDAYDEDAVYAALDRDFALLGAPLVLRLDRWKAHTTPKILQLLSAHGVLVLHGPPHHPRYYGQLERQNREHRAWLDDLGEHVPASALAPEVNRMAYAFNELKPRATLDWRTPAEVWGARPALLDDRTELKKEVEERAARIEIEQRDRGVNADLAMRFAIEQALRTRGYLRIERRAVAR